MSNLKVKHYIPVLGVFLLEQTTPREELVIFIYHLVIVVGTAGSLLIHYL
jgi:hypothetical protein